MYKLANDLSAPFISELFERIKGPIIRKQNTFVRTRVNTVYNGENSLRHKVWDEMLPQTLRNVLA